MSITKKIDTTSAKPVMRSADIRRAVSEWASQGFGVTIRPDGTINVTPRSEAEPADPFDQIDFAP